MVNRVVDFPLEDLAGGEQTVSREGIFANLVFAVVGDSQDLVSGTKPQKLGSASRRNSRDGMGWYSSSNSTDGVYYALPADHPLYSIGIEITIFQIAQIDSWAAYSSLLCVPYQNGSWADPYGAFGLQRDNTANTIRLWGYGGTGTYISNTTSLTVTSGRRHAIGAARYANGCRFLINGQYDDSVAGVNRSSAFSWTNKQPLVILNRSNSNAGEGTTGSAPVTLIFGRALTEPEMRWLADNWREVADIEDAVAPLPTAGGGSYSSTITESTTTTDAATAAYIASVSVSESITAADSLAAATTWVRSLTEAATAAESVTTAGTFAASITEPASVADALTSAVTWARALTEAASASDLATAIRHAVAALTEAATAGDSQTTGSIYTGSLTEAASVSDALTAAATLVALLTEVATASDAATSAATWVRLLTEPATAVDSVAGAQGATYTASVTEVLAAAELLVAVLGSTEALGRYTIAAKARRLTITAKPRRLEIRK